MYDYEKIQSNTRHSVKTAEHFARKMNIGLEKAKQITREITQKGIHSELPHINRRYRIDHLDLQTARFSGKWYVD